MIRADSAAPTTSTTRTMTMTMNQGLHDDPSVCHSGPAFPGGGSPGSPAAGR
jgi:hypothetical protein